MILHLILITTASLVAGMCVGELTMEFNIYNLIKAIAAVFTALVINLS